MSETTSSGQPQVMLPASRIHERISQLAAQIDADYGEGPLVLVGILKGSFVFLADLVRQLKCDARVEFIGISSYGSSTSSSGQVQITKDLSMPVEGLDVLIAEDIIDSGLTLSYLVEYLRARRPNSIRIATLLDKPGRRRVHIPLDYVGFQIPDRFVVGYGLDYAERYRGLPDICVLD